MCLAVPGRVIELRSKFGEPVVLVDFDGTTIEVVASFVPDVRPGDYVIVHAGVALQRLDEVAAAETLALLAEIGGQDDA
jgi:hydrogenase expression/formation protein HypC